MPPFEFIIATNNQHKVDELQGMVNPEVLRFKTPLAKLEVEETGATFHENALLKAKTHFEKWKSPCMADDSGLVVEMLPGEMGVDSANFGGPGLKDRERTELLRQTMERFPNPEDRRAYFVCVLCFISGPNEVFYFEGRMKGSLAFSLSGSEGFGYDPLFIPEAAPGGLSLAEQGSWKKDHSHRAQALKLAQAFFEKRLEFGVAKER